MTLLDELRALAAEWQRHADRGLPSITQAVVMGGHAARLRAIIARHEHDGLDTDQLEDAMRRATSQLAARVDRGEHPDHATARLQRYGDALDRSVAEGLRAAGVVLGPGWPRTDPHAAAVALLRRAYDRDCGLRRWSVPGTCLSLAYCGGWILECNPGDEPISRDTARRLLRAFGEEE